MGETESGLKDDRLALSEEIPDDWFIKERSHSECLANKHSLKHAHTLSPAKFSLVKFFNSGVLVPQEEHPKRKLNLQVKRETFKIHFPDSSATRNWSVLVSLSCHWLTGIQCRACWSREGWGGCSMARLTQQPRSCTISSPAPSSLAKRSLPWSTRWSGVTWHQVPSRGGVALDPRKQAPIAALDTAGEQERFPCPVEDGSGCRCGARAVCHYGVETVT